MAETNSTLKGNGLSDQPDAVRQQLLGQLGLARPEARAAAAGGAPQGGDAVSVQRWLADPRIGPAIVKLIDAIVQAAGAPAAAAAAPSATAGSRGEMKREYILRPGHVEYFPTWSFWGRTFVRMVNTGSVPTVVMINDDRTQLEPGQDTTKDGQWAGFAIRVVNTSESVGSQVSVTVY